MTALRIDGKQMAIDIRGEVAEGVAKLKAETNVTPGLVAVLVGDDGASAIYVRNKGIACEEAGMFSETINLPADTTQEDLLALVAKLNEDDRFHGVLVQLPLPRQIDERTVIQSINPDKDVDGMHPISTGLLLEGNPRFLPATPAGVQQMLMRTGNDPSGKHVVIVGRSNIVGKPLAAMLMQKSPGANATVTVVHTGTKGIEVFTRQADIVVAAVGRANSITADMVKDGAVVIDVGINRIEDATRKNGYRLVGDVAYDEVFEKASAITPVPGGVGPMTIAMLLMNTLRAAQYAAGV
ncbi:MAG: bifunctional 5,10-methylenetetrahydrofolate dehydrogenase/5,10-methenyltetrahydrofolate cyclohydrolase [Chloroflexi bacterium]|nr:bifunctional 5,10-methylenetetrahydrofolate dehydrogenase/5,10-methenyltetrahydrofolate cyclohydrolase [Chloroflexota bacterium]MDA1173772.1 bifunctional 5,10-methylenetetrahydrofolate dehydrogenase/5,10-methenyltetrahydrofolate cyclohydrolase [Chloroflexota bacterium]